VLGRRGNRVRTRGGGPADRGIVGHGIAVRATLLLPHNGHGFTGFSRRAQLQPLVGTPTVYQIVLSPAAHLASASHHHGQPVKRSGNRRRSEAVGARPAVNRAIPSKAASKAICAQPFKGQSTAHCQRHGAAGDEELELGYADLVRGSAEDTLVIVSPAVGFACRRQPAGAVIAH